MKIVGSVNISRGVQANASVPSTKGTSVSGGVDGIPNINISAKDGADGKDGKSAYAYAVESGYQGTEDEFMQSLNNIKEIKFVMPLIYAGL